MEKIEWAKMKANEEEKRTLLNNLTSRRWNMTSHTLRHNENLHGIILEGMIEGKLLIEMIKVYN